MTKHLFYNECANLCSVSVCCLSCDSLSIRSIQANVYWKVMTTSHLQMPGCVGAVWVVRCPVSRGPILTQAAEQSHNRAVFDSSYQLPTHSPATSPSATMHKNPGYLWLCRPVCGWCVRCCDLLILILMFPVNQARYAAAWPPASQFKVQQHGEHTFIVHLFMRAKLSILYI